MMTTAGVTVSRQALDSARAALFPPASGSSGAAPYVVLLGLRSPAATVVCGCARATSAATLDLARSLLPPGIAPLGLAWPAPAPRHADDADLCAPLALLDAALSLAVPQDPSAPPAPRNNTSYDVIIDGGEGAWWPAFCALRARASGDPGALAASVRAVAVGAEVCATSASASMRRGARAVGDLCAEAAAAAARGKGTRRARAGEPPLPAEGAAPPRVRVDVVCYVAREESAERAAALVAEGVARQARQLQALGEGAEALHYQPRQLAHPLTLCSVPRLADSQAAVQERRAVHGLLMLPEAMPAVHPRVALDPSKPPKLAAAGPGGRMRDVHVTLLGADPQSNVDGRVYLVQGSYDYYHYTQDNIDDKGWGCAYRSMQTLWSWLLLAGYTSRAVPMHRQIQETLAALGDKPATFVGSRQWIGAIEISLCLDSQLGVQSKVLFMRSGSEASAHLGALRAHFASEGSPVMIGGGVLAYTLLGVDWSEGTGDARLLILDPHYTGSDSAQGVRQGGWCAWRRVDEVFLSDHFYNLCMPLRPRSI
eukprot:m51a1_g8960 putative ufm1-specific protease 2 (540) ;mRNA; r:1057286-1059300